MNLTGKKYTKPSLLLVFDLDQTLICANSSYQFFHYLRGRKVFSASSLITTLIYAFRLKTAHISLLEFHHQIFDTFLKGISLPLLESEAEQFVSEFLPKALNWSALSCLNWARQMGWSTAILSNSPDFLVRPIAEKLRVTYWDATHYEVDKDRRLCQIANLMMGEEKARKLDKMRVQLGIEKEQVVAYSDSIHDLPMLLAAGTAVGVNPDKKLLEHCLSHDWRVI